MLKFLNPFNRFKYKIEDGKVTSAPANTVDAVIPHGVKSIGMKSF